MFGWVVGKQEVDQKWAERRSMVIRPKKTSGQRQVSHPLRRDSGRSSNRNRHLSPSVNTSRLPITNRKWRAPAVATNGYGRERLRSKKDNLRGAGQALAGPPPPARPPAVLVAPTLNSPRQHTFPRHSRYFRSPPPPPRVPPRL